MNIVRENLDDQTALLKVTVGEADYNEAVDKTLRQYKKKANIPGFRPGMVPMGIINKMYRRGAVAEEAYKMASNACFDYLEKEKIDYIGDLLPSDRQQPLDFENNTEHEFVFEFGVSPEVKIELGAKDKLTRYTIEVSKEMRDGYRKSFLGKFGRLVDVETVEGEEALTVTLDSEAMKVEEAYVGLVSMSEEERKPFLGKKVGDQMDVNINELYKNPAQRAAILHVKEDELAGIAPEFKLIITKIRKFAEPELNEEFFKMAFPQGDVKNEQELDAWFDAQISKDLARESDYLFLLEMREMLMKKANLTLPEAFLKRWLFTINEGKFTMEDIEKDFAGFVEMMKWNIIQKHYIRTLELNVTKEEALEEAKSLTRMQFAQYGMGTVADDMLTNYANSILENKEESRKIYEKLYERKVVDALTPMIKVSEKSVSVDEFGKLAEKYRG